MLQEGFSILPILEIRTSRDKAVFIAAKTREDTASMTRDYKFLGGNRENPPVEEFR